MDVELLKENEDGSADYHVKMSNEEQAQLFRFAFIEMLKRGIEEGKQYEPCEDGMGNTQGGRTYCDYGPSFEPCESGQPCHCAETAKVSD
jgi:hypothetical protein